MPENVLIIGVGNRMRGDDAVGPLAIDKLKESNDLPEEWLLVDAGEVPENALGLVDKEKPDRVILIDACDWGTAPGEIRFFSSEELEKLSIRMLSTHGLPLAFWVKMTLTDHPELKIELLGVQVQSLEFNSGMTPQVAAVLEKIEGLVREHLNY
ncbi:hydrogenase maturation protease [candidate division WOR-3 bacterium]|uniref:Hydrogenase maturation protease n=1 Tax=candidate division WOR-3 bacterium TaxID=2052148 RepID=A0A9D5K7T4_UNCW3|nr:hydrogenase maturation protease [candidate division WOR-3 bacterium]MBD3363903.1 hydrogenase maturation protease [candidate division WOR-3 bacterium]